MTSATHVFFKKQASCRFLRWFNSNIEIDTKCDQIIIKPFKAMCSDFGENFLQSLWKPFECLEFKQNQNEFDLIRENLPSKNFNIFTDQKLILTKKLAATLIIHETLRSFNEENKNNLRLRQNHKGSFKVQSESSNEP